MTDVAIKLIDTFGDNVYPDIVNKDGYTALMYACDNKMNLVIDKLTNKN